MKLVLKEVKVYKYKCFLNEQKVAIDPKTTTIVGMNESGKTSFLSAIAKTNYFDIVGHLDLIKVFKFLPKKDIRLIAKDALKEIKKSNMVLEINPAGLRKPIGEPYPSKELLEEAFALDIPITFGSDAHSVEQVGFGYETVIDFVKKIGYKKCVSFDKRDRKLIEF